MNSLTKYSENKNIPSTWNTQRINTIGKIVNGATPSSGIANYWNGDITWITPTDINNTTVILKSERTITKQGYRSCGTYMIPQYSIILTTRAPIGKVTIAGKALCTNQGCKSIILNKNNDYRFIYYQLLINNKKLNSLGTGTTFMELSYKALKNLLLFIPPKKEQIKIANYLDKKTEQIDRTISQKKELIKLLKERKKILIKNAITQGIDKTVSMMKSGIKWLGKVPKHWDIKKGKYLFKEIDERSKDGKEELLSVSHMTGVTPRSEKNVTMFMSEDYTGSKTCQKDDLVINIMWAWMGALGVSDREGIVSSSYGIYRQREPNTFNSSYLEYLLRTNDYIAEYNRRSTGLHVSRLRLYSDRFLDMKMAIPPIEEQNAIINFIKENNSKIDKAINLQEEQIERLKELKETLIDSCVTGKVKVP